MSPDFKATFEQSEKRAFGGQPLRLTGAGIWLPAPLDVVAAAMRALRGAGFWTRLGDAPKVLDAGMGDGRVVASLCAVGHHVQAYGIEIHHQLSELANENLHDLSERGLPKIWRTCDGSYLDRATYAKLGIHVEDIDAFFNYPDGNEHELAAFLASYARRRAFLVVLTPDHAFRIEGLDHDEDLPIERPSGSPGFHLALYRTRGAAP